VAAPEQKAQTIRRGDTTRRGERRSNYGKELEKNLTNESPKGECEMERSTEWAQSILLRNGLLKKLRSGAGGPPKGRGVWLNNEKSEPGGALRKTTLGIYFRRGPREARTGKLEI